MVYGYIVIDKTSPTDRGAFKEQARTIFSDSYRLEDCNCFIDDEMSLLDDRFGSKTILKSVMKDGIVYNQYSKGFGLMILRLKPGDIVLVSNDNVLKFNDGLDVEKIIKQEGCNLIVLDKRERLQNALVFGADSEKENKIKQEVKIEREFKEHIRGFFTNTQWQSLTGTIGDNVWRLENVLKFIYSTTGNEVLCKKVREAFNEAQKTIR